MYPQEPTPPPLPQQPAPPVPPPTPLPPTQPQPGPGPGADDPKTRVGSSLIVTQPGEVMICHIKRHPIGIIGIYIAISILLLVIGGLAFLLLPTVLDSTGGDRSQANQVSSIILLLMAGVSVIYALIVTKVYWGNSWIVTSDSLTQIEQKNLFSRQSAQLALANIEDVTAEQNGILTHIFNYGVLKAETAGQHSKFIFIYCPNPNYYAQKILAAREALGGGGHGSHGGTHAPPAAYHPNSLKQHH